MPDFLSNAVSKVNDLVESGAHERDAVDVVLKEMGVDLMRDAEKRVLVRFNAEKKKLWANLPDRPAQLRMNFGGDEFVISDLPVMIPDGEGGVRLRPARFTTANERIDSHNLRIEHHRSIIVRSESESRREEEQAARAMDLGIDLSNEVWDKVRHKDNTCWRCGLGWREGDAFELGHSDKPESQGGLVLEWEHRSCNRSAGDNPVARPETDQAAQAADLI